MDCRKTLNIHETFEEILSAAHESGVKVDLLVDDNGLTRTDGFIRKIEKDEYGIVIMLDNNMRISLSKLIAVNGIFTQDFTEC